jgi:glycosyltransferase involved in cell wall biosynthesis
MKILQVCPRYPPDIGGVEEHVRNISERLARKYDVTVFTTDPTGKFQKKAIINSVKIRRFKSWAPSESYQRA